MTQLRLFLLGSPYMMVDQQMVVPETRKAFALLIYLAITEERHARDALATLLWPDQDQGRARRSLRHALWLLKKAGVGDWLVTEGDSLWLKAVYWSDVSAFRAALQENELAEGVSFYRNDFLTGFTLRDCPDFDDWQFRQTEQLRLLLSRALETLTLRAIEDADYQSGLNYAHQWRSLDPLHEPAQRALMTLYAQRGQYAAALRQYQECARVLDEELGIEPEPATQRLYEAIRTRRFSTLAGEQRQDQSEASPGVAEGSHGKHNLSPMPTPFIGRERELHDLDRLLTVSDTRLITILAAGGMGKTRLALAAAERQLTSEQFPGGIHFVPLAAVRTGEDIIPAVAETLAVTPNSDDRATSLTTRLLDYLREKKLLLILDNCEHLIPDIDPIASILQAAPLVRIVATSRERLYLQDEQLFPIQGLDYPQQIAETDRAVAYSAINLFLHRARRIRPDFVPTAGDLSQLTTICQLVEGMPLALELAASWINTLSLGEIASEIQTSLDLLETDLRNIPARQRSIRAVFDATWQRLDDTERDVFVQFSVFRGGFTRDATQTIIKASLRVLASLSDKCLLQYDRVKNRYQIHELLRQYAAEKLAQDSAHDLAVHDRHSVYYCQWLHEKTSHLKDARQETATALIEADIDNVQAAWDWAVPQWSLRIQSIQQAMDGLAYFYERQGRIQNGQEAFRRAAETMLHGSGNRHTAESRIALAKALAWYGFFTFLLGDIASARQSLERGLALLTSEELAHEDTRPERALVYSLLGAVAAARGEEEALSWYERSLELFRAVDRRWEMSEVLMQMGRWVYTLAEFHRAEALYSESLAIKRTLGDRRGVATVLGRLSQVTVEQGQLDRAESLARESSAIYHALENRYGIVEGLRQLGVILMWLGKHQEAHHLLESSLSLGRDLGDRALIAQIHSLIGLASSLLGLTDQAREHSEIGLRLARDFGDPNQIAWCLWVMGWHLVSAEAYADSIPVLHESIDQFRQISTPTNEPRQLGWSLALLGYAQWKRNDFPAAHRTLLEVLTISTRLHDFLPVITALPTVALMLARHGNPAQAVELYALVWRYALPSNSRGWLATVKDELEAIAESLPADMIEAALTRVRASELHEGVVEAIQALKKLNPASS
jgi:predicted ATPase/DNA-binding SARP family transcriptional activator